MDKQSLSKWGGIICVVLILAIVIAFATPFGSFIVSSVKSNLFNFNHVAIDKITNPDIDTSFGNGESDNSGPIDLASLTPGLYQTGSNYKTLLLSWDELISEGIIKTTGEVVSGKTAELAGDLVISDSITTISQYAYSDCTNLTGVVIPSSVTRIGNANTNPTPSGAFSLSGINHVYFCENSQLAIIGTKAFAACPKLTSVKLPESVTQLFPHAFYNCESLNEVSLPSGLKSIGDGAFSYTGLKSITIPATVERLGETLNVDGGNFNYASGVFSCSALETVIFEENSQLKTMGDGVFNTCKNLKTIELPKSVTTIGFNAFKSCENLTTAIIYADIVDVGISFFSGCTKLTEAIFYGDISYISSGMFANCVSLESVTLSPSITKIDKNAFTGCSSLKNVNFGENSSLSSIEEKAFYNCTSLENIIFPEGLETIGKYSFGYCSLLNITIPDSVTSIAFAAFYNCKTLESVFIGTGVTNIGNYVFNNASNANFTYKGTMEQWSVITVESEWKKGNTKPVVCSDGTIANSKTLSAPKISLSSNKYVKITAVTNATSYGIYVDGVLATVVTSTVFNLTTLDLEPGDHEITVNARAIGYTCSPFGTAITYTAQ